MIVSNMVVQTFMRQGIKVVIPITQNLIVENTIINWSSKFEQGELILYLKPIEKATSEKTTKEDKCDKKSERKF